MAKRITTPEVKKYPAGLRIWDFLLLFAINILFYARCIFKDRFMYSTSELLSNFFPFYHYLGSSLRRGCFPLWDPYHYFDFIGVCFPGPFYPFNILLSFLGSSLRLNNLFLLMQADEIFHFFLASSWMFIFIYQLTRRRAGAFLGAIAFVYSGFVAKSLQALPMMHTVVWLPLIFLFFVQATEGRLKFPLLAGIFLALIFLSGYMAVTFYVCFALVLYALWTVLVKYRENNFSFEKNSSLKVARALVITFAVAAGLSAVQLLPCWQYAQLSVRSKADYNIMVMWGSVQPAYLLTLFIPHFFGGARADFWGYRLIYPLSFPEGTFYTGIFAIFLGLVGLSLALPKKVKNMQYFLFFLFIFSIFMMLGKYNSIFGLYYGLRVFPLSRISARWGYFVDFSVAALGGIAFSYLCAPLRKDIKARLISIFERIIKPLSLWLIFAILALVIALAAKSLWASVRNILHFAVFYSIAVGFLFLRLKRRYKKYFAAWLLVFVFLDLFLASSKINPAIPGVQPCVQPEQAFQEDPLVKFLARDKGIYRLSGTPWPLLLGEVNHIFTMGYLGGFSYRRFAEFRGEVNPMGSGAHSWFDLRPYPSSQLIDFYNIKYLVSGENLAALYPQRYEAVSGLQGLYRNKKVFPRAFFVSDFEIMPDSQEILERMHYIDLSKKAILEELPGFIPSAGEVTSQVNITHYDIHKIEIDLEASSDGLLVLSDVYYPGWQVFVDGKKSKILRTNYVFRGVKLLRGFHKVTFIYSPWSVKIGLLITVLTIAILLALLIINLRLKGNVKR